MDNKEIFQEKMDALADAINEKAETTGKKTIDELTETTRGIQVGKVNSVNGRIGDVVLDKSDVNLSNVDNTSDADKPISTATQTALNAKQDTLTAGAGITISNGVISADARLRMVVVEELPATGDTQTLYLVPNGEAEESNIYDEYVYVDDAWEKIGTTEVDLSGYVQKTTTIAGISLENNIAGAQLKTALELSKNDVGLGNVDNTSDLDKPISTATQTALTNLSNAIGGKANVTTPSFNGNITLNSAAGLSLNAQLSVQYVQANNSAITFNYGGSQFIYCRHDGNEKTLTLGGQDVVVKLQGKGEIYYQKFSASGSAMTGFLLGTYNTYANQSYGSSLPLLTTLRLAGNDYRLPANVEANPTLSGSEATLTALKIGNTSYKIPTFDPTAVAGYDASKSQVLTHNQGVLTWVDSAATQSGSEVTLP